MPWNGSNIGNHKKSDVTKKGSSSLFDKFHFSVIKFSLLIVLLLILCIALLLSYLFYNKPVKQVPQNNNELLHSSLTEKTKSSGKKIERTNRPIKKKYAAMTNEEKLRYYKEKYGDNIPSNLKPIVYYLENPPKRNFKPNSRPESIFHNKSEREIAAFLLAEPGRVMIRPVNFDIAFDKNFEESLLKEIEFTPDDTPEQKELKSAVIETKKELLAMKSKGKKPSEVMNEAANELYQLGQYRSQLEKEVLSVRNDPNKSSQDLIETVMAANIMLKEKGLKPIRQPNLFIRKALLNKKSKQ